MTTTDHGAMDEEENCNDASFRRVTFHRAQSDSISGAAPDATTSSRSSMLGANDYLAQSPLYPHPGTATVATAAAMISGSSDHNHNQSSMSSSFRRLQSDNFDQMSPTRRRSLLYDASHVMDRLRSSFIATTPPDSTHNISAVNNDNPHLLPTIPALSTSNTSSADYSTTASWSSARQEQQQQQQETTKQQPYSRRVSHQHLAKTAAAASTSASAAIRNSPIQTIQAALGQVPAIVLIGMFHLMIGIPFGVS